MTIKLIALYKKPDDEVAFLQHFHEVHMLLVMKTPHLVKAEIPPGDGCAVRRTGLLPHC
ncbi:hypothetical protein GCM10009087_48500 [Sphingomonas oligophenolica]|uniref:EthD family reductase n=1 Tax=Sphingomonas oligophenolica TaxID=301154 RepID=A0ABU9YBT4_9SPHN